MTGQEHSQFPAPLGCHNVALAPDLYSAAVQDAKRLSGRRRRSYLGRTGLPLQANQPPPLVHVVAQQLAAGGNQPIRLLVVQGKAGGDFVKAVACQGGGASLWVTAGYRRLP